jgi:hypothetical protein
VGYGVRLGVMLGCGVGVMVAVAVSVGIKVAVSGRGSVIVDVGGKSVLDWVKDTCEVGMSSEAHPLINASNIRTTSI